MATDYDTPRTTDDEIGEDSIEELKSRRDAQTGSVDVDEAELAESLELPGADLSGEELAIKVLPRQADEFTCSHCFLVHHRSQLSREKNGAPVWYLLAANEGHGFAKKENADFYFYATIRFLQETVLK